MVSAFGALVLNVSLLLGFAHVFYLFSDAPPSLRGARNQLAAGLATGAVSVALMLAPYQLEPGIQFDARSVVLSLAGLFFGPGASLVAVGVAGAFRLSVGGPGTLPGVGVAATSAALGLLLRWAWRKERAALRWVHLLALGVVVAVTMLGWMFTLPGGAGLHVVRAIALPILTIHPLATVLVGLTFVGRLRSRAQAEGMARQEARFRLLAENALDVVYRFELRPTPHFSYVSPSVTKLVGYTPEEHYADPNLGQKIVAEEDRHVMAQVTVAERDATTPLLLRWRHKDGHLVWTEQLVKVLRDDHGVPIAIEGTSRDVTAREAAAAHLREREEAYRRLFEAHPRPLWVYDLETLRFVAVNDAAVQHYGYSREEFLAMRITDLRPPEDLPALEANLATLREGHVDHAGTWRHHTKAGRLLKVEITSHLLTFEGRLAELVLADDVTSDHEVRLERERLFTAIEQSPDGVLITDRAGAIEYVNPSFERSSGYSRAEVLGQSPRLLESVQQDPALLREISAALLEGRSWAGRLVNRRKDGSALTLDTAISPVHDAHGAIVSFVAVMRDVSRQLELEAGILQAQKMEGVGRLAAGVAHDFNNLLTIINSTSELAGLDAPPGSQLATDLAEIRAAGQRGAALTRQLLLFTRQQVVRPVVLAPDEVVGGFQKLLRRLMSEDVRLEVRAGAPEALVRIDPGHLEQVVLNLAINARDAIGAGGTVTIETAVVPEVPPRGRRAAAIDARRPLRMPGRPRHGCWHACRRARPALHPLLHHQAAGPGHRARAEHRAASRQ